MGKYIIILNFAIKATVMLQRNTTMNEISYPQKRKHHLFT